MITISSSGDWAIKTAFPVGQWLGLARTSRELHTLGNYKAFRTHVLEEGKCSGPTDEPITENFSGADLCLSRLTEPPLDEVDSFDQEFRAHAPLHCRPDFARHHSRP